MDGFDVRNLGNFIRDQRNTSEISLRQLAKLAGVSNPYLSQIERGLRKPSAEILQQIAKALRISAEALYVQAGILDERVPDSDVVAAVLIDASLSERQKQVLLDIYDSFRRENREAGLTPEGLASAARTAAGTPPATAPVHRRTAGDSWAQAVADQAGADLDTDPLVAGVAEDSDGEGASPLRRAPSRRGPGSAGSGTAADGAAAASSAQTDGDAPEPGPRPARRPRRTAAD